MSFENLDPAILAVLPVGSEALSVVPYGKTRWSVGLRVDVEVNSEKERCFLKIIKKSEWIGMAEGEYESQKALAAIMPDNVAPPIAWGTFKKDTSKAFFITRFRDLDDRLRPAEKLLAILKKLHQTPVSPTGKFGLHITTYNGPPKMINDWTDSWEEYFARQFRSDISFLQAVYGEDVELAILTELFVEKVVARLLRPLQTGGRSLKPSLYHGDLWDGNVQIDVNTGQPVVFDSCAFYVHREMDLQNIGDPRYMFGRDFIDMYKMKSELPNRSRISTTVTILAAICPEWFKLIETGYDDFKEDAADLIEFNRQSIQSSNLDNEYVFTLVVEERTVMPELSTFLYMYGA